MENGVLLTSPQSQVPAVAGCCSIFSVRRLLLLQLKTPSNFHHHHLRLSLTLTPKFSKWDSSAKGSNFNEEEEEEEEEEESFIGNVKKKIRKWWSDKPPPYRNKKRPAIVFDEAIDSIFIFRVFKSFGWFLPVILISFMLSTGLKAFLVTFALYLALSVLFLAFGKLLEVMQWKPARKTRMKRKASSTYASRGQMEEGQEEEIQDSRKGKMDTPTWVGGNNGPVYRGTQDVTNFGGWDFLDDARSMKGTSRVISETESTKEENLNGNGRGVTSKSYRTKDEKISGNGRGISSKSERAIDEKLSGNGRRSYTILLLRLLIVAFPIIGFWAKMFW